MPDNKNSSSPGLKKFIQDLFKNLQSPLPAPGPQTVLPMALLQMLMRRNAETIPASAPRPTPRPDIFRSPDPYLTKGQKYAAGELTYEVPLDKGGYSVSAFGAAQRPEGVRFYEGRSYDPAQERADIMSLMDLQKKIMQTPADSITTDYAKKMMSPEAFRDVLSRLKDNPDYLRRLQGM